MKCIPVTLQISSCDIKFLTMTQDCYNIVTMGCWNVSWLVQPCFHLVTLSKDCYNHVICNLLWVNNVMYILHTCIHQVPVVGWALASPPYEVNSEIHLLICYNYVTPLYGWKPLKCKPKLHLYNSWVLTRTFEYTIQVLTKVINQNIWNKWFIESLAMQHT